MAQTAGRPGWRAPQTWPFVSPHRQARPARRRGLVVQGVFSERRPFFDEAGRGLFLTRLETYSTVMRRPAAGHSWLRAATKMEWPGRPCRTRPQIAYINVSGNWSSLAKAAGSPGSAATATAATTTAAAAASPTTAAASATPAATATAPGELYASFGRRCVLLVEHIERRQADVGDFFLAKHDLVTQSKVRRLRYVGRRHRCC